MNQCSEQLPSARSHSLGRQRSYSTLCHQSQRWLQTFCRGISVSQSTVSKIIITNFPHRFYKSGKLTRVVCAISSLVGVIALLSARGQPVRGNWHPLSLPLSFPRALDCVIKYRENRREKEEKKGAQKVRGERPFDVKGGNIGEKG